MLHVIIFNMLLKVVCKTNVPNRSQNSPLVFIRISKLMLPLRKYSSSKTSRNTIRKLKGHLYDIMEKTKPQRWKTDQQCLGTGSEGRELSQKAGKTL